MILASRVSRMRCLDADCVRLLRTQTEVHAARKVLYQGISKDLDVAGIPYCCDIPLISPWRCRLLP